MRAKPFTISRSRLIVLDTNIWLDWLVFDDADIAPIKAAVAAGTVEIFIDPACEQELVRVLAYPLGRKTLDTALQTACLAECRRIARKDDGGRSSKGRDEGGGMRDEGKAGIKSGAMKDGNNPLPVCRDPNDQKFLELARDCRADYLVTKDLALLELARRKIRRVPFHIVTPQQFSAALRSKHEGGS